MQTISKALDLRTLEDEKKTLSQVAEETKARLLADPDEHGYTPRALVTEEQKIFLEALSTGEIFEQWK